MTDLLRFLLRHAVLGMVIGIAFTALILVLDIGQIRTLTASDPAGMGVRLLLAFFIGSTFASLQMGIAVMYAPPGGEGEDEDRHGSGED
ncbi:hypothetical protein OA2633_00785 [Oceanicaulis sp. HTCC2633]|jgi:hypothetical protein|uniref:hypothetical protein n=1 Tax=Oceanicaulis sp. HTCC2633 TaxID=314254 RepID=UPI0000669A64|nr:hypothetical protein [Oceanicaulis sp. HTCC2633]EAP89284.1 hypothetical protein OA2633_00785 [Oceanicaulis sp. HTCC2633]